MEGTKDTPPSCSPLACAFFYPAPGPLNPPPLFHGGNCFSPVLIPFSDDSFETTLVLVPCVHSLPWYLLLIGVGYRVFFFDECCGCPAPNNSLVRVFENSNFPPSCRDPPGNWAFFFSGSPPESFSFFF